MPSIYQHQPVILEPYEITKDNIINILHAEEGFHKECVDFVMMNRIIRFIKINNILFDKILFLNKIWRIMNVDSMYAVYTYRYMHESIYLTKKLNCQLLHYVSNMECEWYMKNTKDKFTFMHNLGYHIYKPYNKIII